MYFFFFKQKTAYEMRISDWSSDVCSSDLPDFFERNHPNWLSYTMRDMIRVAQFHGIPFGPPRPDTIVQNVATREIAAEQPYIHRLTRLGQAASRRGRGLAFCDEVAQLIWGDRKSTRLNSRN